MKNETGKPLTQAEYQGLTGQARARIQDPMGRQHGGTGLAEILRNLARLTAGRPEPDRPDGGPPKAGRPTPE